jgi:formylmethanofuran dehydrogenase subunit A
MIVFIKNGEVKTLQITKQGKKSKYFVCDGKIIKSSIASIELMIIDAVIILAVFTFIFPPPSF